jgi:hypothetical protein
VDEAQLQLSDLVLGQVRTQGPWLDLALEQVWMHEVKSHPLVQQVRMQWALSDLALEQVQT